MLEMRKLCDAFEKMPAAERSLMLTGKSAVILRRMRELPQTGIDPVAVLAGFMIGASAADGRINEKEYLMMYPALVRVFGEGFDYRTVKDTFGSDRDCRKTVETYTAGMIDILSLADEELKWNIIILCLCVASADGKISLRERRYINRLCG